MAKKSTAAPPARRGLGVHLGTTAAGKKGEGQNLAKQSREDRAAALQEQMKQLIASLELDAVPFLGDESEVNRKKRLIQCLVGSLNIVSTACAKAGVGRARYYVWLRDDPHFASIAKELPELTTDFVEQRLFNLISNSDTAATIFFLKTRGKARGYVERIEQTGPNGGPIMNANVNATLAEAKAELPVSALSQIYGALMSAQGVAMPQGASQAAAAFQRGRVSASKKSDKDKPDNKNAPASRTAKKRSGGK